ncbi:MAG: alpha/beta fold hydrolase, partial [Chloroflexi bacterium]|nr:alpha/beta fold hydrolase [Chloroflexota bacterium]
VYELYGVEDRLRILWRPGSHETWPPIIERYLDWCDTQFGRGQHAFPERLIHPWDWERQQAVSRVSFTPQTFQARSTGTGIVAGDGTVLHDTAGWERQRQQVRAHVTEMFGNAPPVLSSTGGSYGAEPAHIASLMGRADAGAGLEKQQLVFGEYIAADIYMPAGLRESGSKAPAILWLHPFAFSNGYVAIYRRGEPIYQTLARAGYAVFCFDQVGCGRRIEEVEGFYRRYPDWSLLGKLVRDGQAALDALNALHYVDAQNIWGVGYGLGALVGLHLGALDERLAGFASVCGPPAFRLDKDEARTGGIRRWAQLHMLLPSLGHFIGQEERAPYDVDELLACFAPKPVLVVSPQLDREAPPDLVTPAVEAARSVYALYGAADKLEQLVPEDYNRFAPEMQRLVLEWLRRETVVSHLPPS